MAGEFLVAAELNRRQILSAVTYGSSKSADVWAFADESRTRARVEVKTTTENTGKWVVGGRALNSNRPRDVFWALVILPEPARQVGPLDEACRGRHAPRFFIWTAEEMWTYMNPRLLDYQTRYLAKHGREFIGTGVPTVPFSHAQPYENAWEKIEQFLDIRVTDPSGM